MIRNLLPVLNFDSDNWNDPQTVTVRGRNDDRVNAGGQRVGEIKHWVQGRETRDETVRVAVLDDDEARIDVSQTSLTLNETPGSSNHTGTFTVVLTSEPAPGTTVTVLLSDLSSDVATYTASGESEATEHGLEIKFNANTWRIPRTITVTAVDNHTVDTTGGSVMELESFSSDQNYNLIEINVRVIKNDDETAGVTVSPTSLEVLERGEATYTVVLDTGHTRGKITVTPESAAPEVAAVSGALEFTTDNWDQPQTVTVSGLDVSETRTVTIKNEISIDRGGLGFDRTDGGYATLAVPNVEATVLDDPRGVTINPSSLTVSEDPEAPDHSATYTVVLDSEPLGTVTVAATSADTNVATVTPSPLTFTMDDWNSPQTVTVKAVPDDLDEADAEVLVSHDVSGANYHDVEAEDLTVTVTDDDVPGLTFDPTKLTVNEPDGTETYTVRLDTEPVGGEVAVRVLSRNASVVDVNTSLTFTSEDWDDPQTVTVTVFDDAIDHDPDRMADIGHWTTTTGGASDYDGLVADLPVTVTDDEQKGIEVDPSSLTVSEDPEASDNTATYTVVLTSEPTANVTVTPASDDTGAATVMPSSLTFTPDNWNTSQTVTVTGVDDDIDNVDDKREVTLAHAATGGGYDDVEGEEVAVTVTDDEETPTVTLKLSPARITEDGEQSTVTATLSWASGAATEVTIGAQAVEPAVAADFTLSADAVLTIDAGATASTGAGAVTITANDNNVDAPDKKVTVSGTATNAHGVTDPAARTLTIVDDDTAGITVTPTALEVEEGGSAPYTVVLTSEPTGNVTVTPASGDTGIATVSGGPLTFTPDNWSTAQTVTVTGVDDTLDNEGDQRETTVTHTVSGGDYGSETAASVAVTVTDDDERGVTVMPTELTVTEAAGDENSATYTVVLTSEPTANVTVTPSSGDTGIATVSGGPLTFTPGNWSTAQTVTVTGVDDTLDNADNQRTTTITHTVSGGDYGSETADSVMVTVTDDEGMASLTINSPEVDEGDSGTALLTYTVTLSPASAQTVTVDYADAETGTATSGTDYTALSAGTLAFAAGDTAKTITVTVTGDQVDEDDETVVIALSNASAAATLGTATGTGTIRDDDGRGVTVTPTELTVTEAAGAQHSATYTVVLTSEPTANVTVTPSSGDTGIATVSGGPLTFTPGNWSTAQTVTVTGVDDTLDNADNQRTTTITHTVSGGDYGSETADSVMVTVTDDEGMASLTINSPEVDEGDSGTALLTYTVTLSPASAQTVTVDYADAETGTATSGTDYTALSAGTLAFAAGDTAKTITVTVTGDQVDEDDETVVIALSNASAAATLGTATGTGTIRDDDGRGVTVTPTELTVTEAAGDENSATYTVVLTSEPTANVTVTPSSGDTGIATVSGGPLTFTPGNWSTAQTVTVTGVDDTLDNADNQRTTTITHTVSGGDYGSETADSVMVTVTDDEGMASLTINSPEVDEGDSGTALLTYTVTLSPASAQTVTVDYADAETGTATSGTDYTALSAGTLAFAAGDTAKTITVTVTGDQVDEDDETVVIALSNASAAATLGTATGTGTIRDDDGRGVTVTPTELTVTEAAGDENSATYTVVLTSEPTGNVTVTPSSGDTGIATVSGGPLTFTPGNWSTAQTVTVTGVDDTLDNADNQRTTTITHTVSGGDYGSETADSVMVTVTDDEGMASLTINSPEVDEGDSGTALLTYTVTLSPASAQTVTVDYADAETGTATSGTDYTALSAGTLAFAAGDTAKTITVTVTGDQVDEDDETVVIALSNASAAATLGTATGTGTIRDDDGRGVTVTPTELTVTEAAGDENSATYTVVLTSEPTANVTVTPSSGDTGIATVSGGPLTFTPGNWSTAQTVTVTGVDDTLDNADNQRTTTITHTVSGGDYGSETADSVTVTVTDDEGMASLTINSPEVDEGDSGTALLTYTVTLSPASAQTVTVDYADAETGTATSGTDYTALSAGTLAFAAGDTAKTITVTVTGDQVDEDDETVVIALSNASAAATLGTATGTGTIRDDDGRGVTVTPTELTVTEAAGAQHSATYTVVLTSEPTANVTVTPSSGDTGIATVSGGPLTFTPGNWSTAQTVTVTGVDDTLDNADNQRTTTITHTVSGGDYGSETADSVMVTVTDDEGMASLTINSPEVDEGDSGTALLTYTVTLSPASAQTVTVDYADAETGTATSGTDYTALSAGTLAFAAGDTAKTITVTVTGDQVDEDDETVVIALSNASAAATLGTATGTGTIRDDDGRGVTVTPTELTVTEAAGDENSATYTVVLTSEPTANVTVTPSSGDTGIATVSGGPLTFTPGNWSTAQTVTVTGVDDTLDNADNQRTTTITHTVSGGDYGSETADSVMVTVTDDEGMASLTINSPEVDEGDSGTALLTYTVTLSPASAQTVTVDYADAETGTATSGTDYTALSAGTLAFAAGDTAKTITVTVTGDQVDEDDETVVIALSNASAAATLGTATGTGTIRDDDGRGVTVTPTELTVTEAAGDENSATYTVVLTSEPTGNVTVTPSSGDTGIATVSGGPLTFTPGNWSTAQTVTVTGVDDTLDNADNQRTTTITHTVSGGDYGSETADSVMVTVTDDEGMASLTINSPEVDEGDSGTALLTYTVTLSPASAQTVTVDYADAETGTATSGTDYTALSAGTLAFAPGETTKTIAVSVIGDEVDEPDETAILMLSDPSAGVTLAEATGTGTIRDDDTDGGTEAPPSLTIDSPEVAEGDSGTALLTYTVTLSPASAQQVTVDYADAGTGTATPGTDYEAVSAGILAFAPGETTKTIAASVIGDEVDEPDETAILMLSDPSAGVTLAEATGTGTIRDDDTDGGTDAPPSLTIDSPEVAEGDSGTALLTYTVTLSPASAQQVTVDYADAGTGTATPGTDYEAVSAGILAFAPGETTKTIAASVIGDEVDEPDETAVLMLSDPSAGVTLAEAIGTGTIRDDDDDDTDGGTEAPPSLTIDSPEVAEGDSGTALLTYTVTLSPASAQQVTVDYADAGTGTATPGTDYEAVSAGILAFAPGETTKTIAASVIGDEVDEPDETAVLMLSDPSAGVTLAEAIGTGTIRDDDDDDTDGGTEAPPSLTIDSPEVAEGDSGTALLTYTVRLSPASAQTVTVDYADAGTGTATPGTDYEAVSAGILAFAPGETTKTIAVTVAGDRVHESDETVIITLSDPSSRATLGREIGTGTIRDDDTRGVTVTPTKLTVTEAAGPQHSAPYTVVLTSKPTSAVTVSAASGDETVAMVEPATLTFTPADWNTVQTVTVTGVDDDVDNADGQRTTVIAHAVRGGGYGGVEAASVTVIATDDDSAEQELIGPLTEELLGRQALLVMDDVNYAVSSRVRSLDSAADSSAKCSKASFSPGAGAVSAAMSTVNTLTQASGRERSDWSQLLDGLTFTLPLGGAGEECHGNLCCLSVWGVGTYHNLSDNDVLDWNGELMGAQLGVDSQLSTRLVAGVAVSRSSGSFDFRDEAVRGEFGSALTTVHPYLGWNSGGGLRLWGTAGFGRGRIKVSEEDRAAQFSGTRLQAVSISGSRTLSAPERSNGASAEWNLNGEATVVEMSVDGSGLIRAGTVDGSRLRLAVEWRYERALSDGGSLGFTVESGVRRDEGFDFETGGETGAEVRVGVEWRRGRFTLGARGRGLIGGETDEWGADVLLRLASRAGGAGLSLNVRPSYGIAASGVQRLWDHGVPRAYVPRTGAAGSLGRLEAELGYGFGAFGGRFTITPEVSLGLSNDSRDYGLGWQLSPSGGDSSSLELRLGATRREAANDDAEPEHGLQLQLKARW